MSDKIPADAPPQPTDGGVYVWKHAFGWQRIDAVGPRARRPSVMDPRNAREESPPAPRRPRNPSRDARRAAVAAAPQLADNPPLNDVVPLAREDLIEATILSRVNAVWGQQ
jgi:hypothetical protein